MDTEKKIIEIIERLRPFLIGDGGDIEFIKYENFIVYVKMIGACAHCHLMDVTLKDGIEAAIQFEIPEVLEVINMNGMDMEDM